MPSKRLLLAAGAAALLAAPLIVSALAQQHEGDEALRDRVANLSLTEKEELRRKRDQFQRLDDAEKQRLRQLHQAIAASPDRQRLESVTLHYHEWLKTLTQEQRENLLSLPEDKKLDEIKRLMQEQRSQRLREAIRETRLEPADARAIFTWMDQYASKHEGEMLALLSEETRSRITRIPPSPMRRGMLLMALGQRPDAAPLPPPSEQELKQLAEALSAKPRAALAEARTGDEGLKLVQGWMRAAVESQRRPPVSNERLMDYFRERRGQLKPEELEELENLPPEQFFAKIRERFFRERPGGWRGHHHEGRPFGRDGDGPRGRGDGRRDRDDDDRRGPDRPPRPQGQDAEGQQPDGPHGGGPRPPAAPAQRGPRPPSGPPREAAAP